MKTHNILSNEEFKSNIGRNSRLLGIDPGKKNVGIAICDENQMVATPLKTIQKIDFESLLKELKDIIKENKILGIVVGNPINMDGSSGKSSQSASDFCINLSKIALSLMGLIAYFPLMNLLENNILNTILALSSFSFGIIILINQLLFANNINLILNSNNKITINLPHKNLFYEKLLKEISK